MQSSQNVEKAFGVNASNLVAIVTMAQTEVINIDKGKKMESQIFHIERIVYMIKWSKKML